MDVNILSGIIGLTVEHTHLMFSITGLICSSFTVYVMLTVTD